MRAVVRVSIAIFLLVVLFSVVFSVGAQENPPTPGRCGSTEVQRMLDDINAERIKRQTLVPMVLNHDLCNMAYEQALAIAIGDFPSGDPRRRNGLNGSTSVKDWVTATSFKPYPTNVIGIDNQLLLDYALDIRTFVTQFYDYDQVISYLFSSRQEDDTVDIFTDPHWREIGIAQVPDITDSGITYYDYVFIAGAQPNVLPIIGYIPGVSEHIAVSTFQSSEVTFWLSNENYYKGADDGVVGQIRYYAIDRSLDDVNLLKCPPTDGEETSWKSHNRKIQDNLGAAGGPITLQIRLCDGNGRTVTLPIVMEVGDSPGPRANFEADPTSGTVPLKVQFTTTSSGTISQWAWDFDKNGIADSTEPSPAFTFHQPGEYEVQLTVTDLSGRSDTAAKIITVTLPPVTQEPPVAAITASLTNGFMPLVVDFDASQSTGEITNYLWDFNGDNLNESDSVTSQYRFAQSGTHTVRLTVIGPGGSSVDEEVITVVQPPNVDANFNAEPIEGFAPLTVQFTDTSTGPVAVWAWDFDSDTAIDSPDKNPTYVYQKAKSYIAKLTACDAAGKCDSFERNIIVNAPIPECPTANFTANTLRGPGPLRVEFTNTSTGQIDTVVWDFQSDGTGDSNEPTSVGHVYDNPGSYIAKLTVSNACGSRESTQTIIVESPLPPTVLTATVGVTGPTALSTNTPLPLDTPTIAVTAPLPTATDTPEPAPCCVSPEITPTLSVPLTLIWTRDYAVLLNSSGRTLKVGEFEDLEFAGSSGETFFATTWIAIYKTDTQVLDSVSANLCLVVYRLDHPYPGLEELKPYGCEDVKVRATGSEFWQETPFLVRRGADTLTQCTTSPCLFDLDGQSQNMGGAGVQDTGANGVSPLPPSSSVSDSQAWLSITWGDQYLLVRNASNASIPGETTQQLFLSSASSGFQGHLWEGTSLKPNECFVVMRNDTTSSVNFSNYKDIDEGCSLVKAEAVVTPFWAGEEGFSVQLNNQILTFCDTRGQPCSVPQP